MHYILVYIVVAWWCVIVFMLFIFFFTCVVYILVYMHLFLFYTSVYYFILVYILYTYYLLCILFILLYILSASVFFMCSCFFRLHFYYFVVLRYGFLVLYIIITRVTNSKVYIWRKEYFTSTRVFYSTLSFFCRLFLHFPFFVVPIFVHQCSFLYIGALFCTHKVYIGVKTNR